MHENSSEFRGRQTIDKLCHLKISLYGLKQSSRAWFDRFRQAMIRFGYQQSNADHTLFIYLRGNKTTMLIIYVDDIVLTSNDEIS